jgi:hypothetical protein
MVQAPQAAIPHPYLVPTKFKWSLNTHNKGVDGSTVTAISWPFTLRLNVVIIGSYLKICNKNTKKITTVTQVTDQRRPTT